MSGRMNRPVASRILLAADRRFPRHSEASLVSVSGGRILMTWSRFENRRFDGASFTSGVTGDATTRQDALDSDNDVAVVAAAFMDPDSLENESPWVLAENPNGLNAMSPALGRLDDGSIGLSYSLRHSAREAERIFSRSTDEGASWGEERSIASGGYITGCHDRLLVLEDGRLINPLHCTEDWYSHYLKSFVAWSDDKGRTWNRGHSIELPKVEGTGESGAWEAGATERADGSLLLVLRSAMGTLFQAESFDRGESWANLRSLELSSPVAPGKICRIPRTADLVMIWNWNYCADEPMSGRRTHLAAALSTDGGRSWPLSHRKLLSATDEVSLSYPSCFFHNDVAYISCYESALDDPFGRRSLRIFRVDRDWFYAPADPAAQPEFYRPLGFTDG